MPGVQRPRLPSEGRPAIIPDPSLSIYDGGIQASGWGNIRSDSIARMYFDALSQKYHFDLHAPISSLSKEAMDVILYGTHGEKLTLHYDRGSSRGTLEQAFEGIIPNIERRVRETQSEAMRKELEETMSASPARTAMAAACPISPAP